MDTIDGRVSMPSAHTKDRALRPLRRLVDESETQHGYRIAALRERRRLNRERIAAFVDASRDIWSTTKTWNLSGAPSLSPLPSFAVATPTPEKTAIEGWEDEGGSVRPPAVVATPTSMAWQKLKRIAHDLFTALKP